MYKSVLELSFIRVIKDKMQSENVRNVLHKGHEGQIAVRESEKCPS